MSGKNWKKTALFLGLTFSLNYLLVILYLALGGKWVMPGSLIISVIYMFIPMTVTIFLQKTVYKKPLQGPLEIYLKPNRWFAVAWLLPPVLSFAILGINLLMPGVEYSPEMAGLLERFKDTLPPEQYAQVERQVDMFPLHPIWIGLLQGLIAGVTVNAVAGFGEELGWRGFLQKELGHLGFWKSAALIGVVWGVWHAPIILQGHNYPQHPTAGVLMMTVFTLLLSPIFSYIRLRAKSVIAAAIIHGSLNATFGLSLMVTKGGNDLTVGATGLAGFIVLALANVGLFVYERFLAKEPLTARQ
ncbi:MAG: CPBP family intramembrane metalloprotease [Chloroflexi bacterium]|nr:CPBP family intramembrane metalloprotease [Chloroflexota bacterium]